MVGPPSAPGQGRQMRRRRLTWWLRRRRRQRRRRDGPQCLRGARWKWGWRGGGGDAVGVDVILLATLPVTTLAGAACGPFAPPSPTPSSPCRPQTIGMMAAIPLCMGLVGTSQVGRALYFRVWRKMF